MWITHWPTPQAYRLLALKLHPDKNPDKSAAAQSSFTRVQKAYELLSDKQARAALDELQKCAALLSRPCNAGRGLSLRGGHCQRA